MTFYSLVAATAVSCSKDDEKGGVPIVPISQVSQVNAGVSSYSGLVSVRLSWSAVSGADYYEIYWSDSQYGQYLYMGESYSTYYTDEDPIYGTNYYKVRAVSGTLYGPFSGVVSAIVEDPYANAGSGGNNSGNNNGGNNNTGSGSDETENDNTGGNNQGGGSTSQKPSVPTGLSGSWGGPAAYPYVSLSWNSVSNATSYIIYRSSSASGSYSQIGESTYASYMDQNVSIGKTYYYKVKASNNAGTSDYSSYASVTIEDQRTPGPVTYGNCTATSTQITLRWSVPTDPSYGKPTKFILRLYEPTYNTWVDAQELSGTATSATFNFGMWIDSSGYVKCAIISYNENGSGGGYPKVYDTISKKWIN